MNPPNGQAPLDYLNQIAPQAQKKPIFELNFRTVIMGAVLLVILVIVISVISGAISNSRKEPWERLSARLETTTTIVNDAGSKLKSGQLRSANSDLKLYLTNTQRDITTHLTSRDISAKKLPASIVAAESGTDILADLEDGRLNARYDTTYAREVGYQLATLVGLLKQLINSSSGSSKQFLQTAHDNLYPTYEVIENFSTANQ